jgi:hypothetical protein
MGIRSQVNFVPHVHLLPIEGDNNCPPITNVIVRVNDSEDKWIEETTEKIGDWRSLSRTTYIRWSLAINGLMVASERYQDWPGDRKFVVKTMRIDGEASIAEWSGETTSEHCKSTAELIAANCIVDLYGCLEEVVFEAYRIYLNHNPLAILPGDCFRELRRLFRKFQAGEEGGEAWPEQWEKRVTSWQRKRLYDGLGKVLKSYFQHTGLERPSWYQLTTVDTWAETISGISELRNLITHGGTKVSQELADFSERPFAATFDFETGAPLVVKTHHMQSVEMFIDQLLFALNISLTEKAFGAFPVSDRPETLEP